MTIQAKVLFRLWTAGSILLVWRRAQRDGPLLLAWMLTIAFAAFLAIAGPAHLVSTIDAGAREAVSSGGSATDVVVEAAVQATNERLQLPGLTPPEVEDEARSVTQQLPDALRQTLDAPTVAVTGPVLLVSPAEIQPGLGNLDMQLQLAPTVLTAQNLGALTTVTGVLPGETAGDDRAPIPVVISTASAQASSLDIGSVISLPITDKDVREQTALRAEVVGTVRELPAGATEASPWRDVTQVWDPNVVSDGRSTFVSVALLMSPASADRLIRSQGSSFTAVWRYSFDPAAFTGAVLNEVSKELRQLVSSTSGIASSDGEPLKVSSGLADAVADFPDRARTTLAELSIIVAGVVGAAGTVLVLASRLIVTRRIPDLMLERARGSSLIAITLRNVIESIVIVIVAVSIAAALARGARLDGSSDVALLTLVVAIGLCATVVQILAALHATSRVSTTGVNRRDVLLRRRQRRVAQFSVELGVLVLAAVSMLALLSRGLLQTSSEGIDPLIACAPLFFAAAVTVLVFRGSRLLVRAIAAAATLSRGIAGPVISSRLPQSIGVVPLAALTIAIALAVSTGIIGSTVRSGQLDASWQAVGADARVEGGVSAEDVTTVASAEGVDVASGFTIMSAQLDVGSNGTAVTLVAVDRDYPRFLAQLPDIDGRADRADVAAFGSLSRTVPVDEPLPVILGSLTTDRTPSGEVALAIGADDVAVKIVGVVRSGADGSAVESVVADETVIYVDQALLADRLSSPIPVDSIVAIGSGAADAAASLDLGGSVVVTRVGWLDDRRRLALVSGVEQAMLAGGAALAVLALVAIVCTALAGSSNRARCLALLRTLGVHRRFGVFLAVIDQLPLLVASLVGGMLAGLGIAVLLVPALGLEFLTGSITSPEMSTPPLLLIQVTGAVVLVFGIGTLSEVLLRRRDRVSDTIRVGETV